MINLSSYYPHYHSRIDNLLLEYLSEQLPDFVITFNATDECPKDILDIQYSSPLFNFRAANIYINSQGEISISFNWFVNGRTRERIRKVITDFCDQQNSEDTIPRPE